MRLPVFSWIGVFFEGSLFRCKPKLDCNSISMEISLNCTRYREIELREKNLDLWMIPMNFDNLLANRDMWGFQVRLSSKKTPKNMVSETRRIDCSFIYRNLKFKRLLFCQGVNTIKLVADKFKENRFAASQVENLFNFLFNVLIN